MPSNVRTKPTRFSDIRAEHYRPGKTLIFPSWGWADSWGGRQTADVCLGLRIASESDKMQARIEAESKARAAHKDGELINHAFNDCLVRQVAARCVCDPNDVRKPSQFLQCAEDVVEAALSTRGVQLIYNEYLKYEVEVSPLQPEATEEDMVDLVARLTEVDFDQMPQPFRSLALRYLRFALDQINEWCELNED